MKDRPLEQPAARLPYRPTPNRANNHRWDEIGGYVISTIRLPVSIAVAVDASYETLVYALVDGRWDADGSGVQSESEAEADAAHAAARDRIRGRIV